MARKRIKWFVDENGCHICTSHHINQDGYPCLWKDGRNQNMHRVLYEEYHGITLPSSVLVRHTCEVVHVYAGRCISGLPVWKALRVYDQDPIKENT